MPVYYVRKIMFYGAIDMTAQTTRAKIAIGYRIGHLRVEEANETKTAARSLLLPGNAA